MTNMSLQERIGILLATQCPSSYLKNIPTNLDYIASFTQLRESLNLGEFVDQDTQESYLNGMRDAVTFNSANDSLHQQNSPYFKGYLAGADILLYSFGLGRANKENIMFRYKNGLMAFFYGFNVGYFEPERVTNFSTNSQKINDSDLNFKDSPYCDLRNNGIIEGYKYKAKTLKSLD